MNGQGAAVDAPRGDGGQQISMKFGGDGVNFCKKKNERGKWVITVENSIKKKREWTKLKERVKSMWRWTLKKKSSK